MARPKTQLNRKTEILDAAQSLFMEKGFEKATIQEIADILGIGKGTIYLEFKNKEEIHLSIVERYAKSSLTELKQHVEKAQAPFLKEFERILIEHPLSVYDKAVFHMQSYAAAIHTSINFKIKLDYLIDEWHEQLGIMLRKSAENNEIQTFCDYKRLAKTIHLAFKAFLPPYDYKYSYEYSPDLTKKEIRQELKKDLTLVTKLVLEGLKTVKTDNLI